MFALKKFGPEDTVEWFRSLGVEPFVKEGGYVYPHSGQAASVLNALRSECGRTGVRVVTACTVKDIRRKKDGGFRVLTDLEMFAADRLILACGSKASPGTGSDGSGFALAEKLGHRIVEPLPALCGLYCAEKEFFRIEIAEHSEPSGFNEVFALLHHGCRLFVLRIPEHCSVGAGVVLDGLQHYAFCK